MQKQISKNGLLVLTLSILLAVSMCLTITFAAFQSSQNITGTVSFSGGVEMTVNGAAGTLASGDIDFSVNMATKAITQTGGLQAIGFDADGAGYFWKVTLTLNNQSYITFNTSATSQQLEAIKLGNVTPTINDNKTITWITNSAVSLAANLDIDGMIAALPINIDTAAIGSASSAASLDTTATATLVASAALNASNLT